MHEGLQETTKGLVNVNSIFGVGSDVAFNADEMHQEN